MLAESPRLGGIAGLWAEGACALNVFHDTRPVQAPPPPPPPREQRRRNWTTVMAALSQRTRLESRRALGRRMAPGQPNVRMPLRRGTGAPAFSLRLLR